MNIQVVILIGLIIVGIYALRIVLELFSKSMRRKRQLTRKFIILEVRVSKENETGPIVAEQIFSSVHGIYRSLSFFDRLFGGQQDRISMEVANVGSHIKFYFAFPAKYQNFIEGQIYAQYPDVEINVVKDYTSQSEMDIALGMMNDTPIVNGASSVAIAQNLPAIQKKKDFRRVDFSKNVFGMELGFNEPDIYPIKRYAQFEDKINQTMVDPMAGITATLAKLHDVDEQAWVQIIIRPLGGDWMQRYVKCLKILAKGVWSNVATFQDWYTRAFITRNKLKRIIFFPVYFLFWLRSMGANSTSVDMSSSSPDESTSRTHDRETASSAAMDKVVKLLYETTIRVVYVQKDRNQETARIKLQEIASSFKQFNIPQLNGFQISNFIQGRDALARYNKRIMDDSMVMNVEELATLYHLPNKNVSTPNIFWVRSRKLEPPTDLPVMGKSTEDLTLLGRTNFRGIKKTFGIKSIDRRRHIYVIGKTGMGKTTLLENMIFSDIQAGKGVGIIDPHGDLAETVLNYVPASRTNDVVLFDPSDRDFPVAFNMLESKDPALNTIIASGLLGVFKKLYAHSWGPRLEHILRNTLLALLEYPNTTMLGITRMLQDKDFRRKVVRKVQDPIVRAFWEKEFEPMQDRQKMEAISPILNKVGQFLSSPIIRNIVGQPKSTVDLRFAMDKGKIIIMNLSKGKLGEDNSQLLGSMLITKFQIDAMSRANIPEKERRDFYLYVDEFQNFATDSFATILSEARKYHLNLTMANQYIAQMPDEVRDAVFGNVGSTIAFQVGFDDAEYLSSQFGEEALPSDLVSLSKYTAYTKLLVDGMPSKTYSLDALPPPEFDAEEGRAQKIMKVVRERYSTKRELVEDKIKRWSLGTSRDEIEDGKKGR
jgi:Type IV secretion-system coupling protein DNA-binding domain